MKSTNLKTVTGGRSPASTRRQIRNALNTTSSRDVFTGPSRIRTIDVTSPNGQVQQNYFFDNRPTGGSKRTAKAVAAGAAVTTISTLGTLALTDYMGETDVYNGAINKESE